MCTNYIPSSREFIQEKLSVKPVFAFKAETFPGYDAPIVRKVFDSGELECVPARFGLVPFWAKEDQVVKLSRIALQRAHFDASAPARVSMEIPTTGRQSPQHRRMIHQPSRHHVDRGLVTLNHPIDRHQTGLR